MYSTETGISRHGTQKWTTSLESTPLYCIIKVLLDTKSLVKCKCSTIDCTRFFPIVGSVHGIPIGATTQGCYIKIRLILNQPEIDFEPFSMYSKQDTKSL